MTLRRILGNLAKSLDSSAIGSYLSKGASETDFRAILYSEISGTPSVVGDSAVATAIVDSAYVQARQGSTTSLTNIDSAASLAILDSDYMQSRITGGGVGFKVYHFETTNGQTTFQDSDADGDVLGYTENGILVFKNGVLLLDSSDYTASDGTSVVLTSGTDSGELVSIAKWSLGGGGGAGAAWYGDRGVFNKGSDGSTVNTLEYVDITTPGNSTDFGDLTVARYFAASCSDATSGVWHGGTPYTTTIDYITIATTGNATDFGDITLSQSYTHAGCSDGTYGVFGGIATSTAGVNTMDYITVASPGNATDFGDLTLAKDQAGACADATYGLFFAGNQEGVGRTNNIDYVTIATPGNASDFGDVGTAATGVDGCSDTTRGLMGGGITASAKVNTIEYVTIATPGNATDFGDLTQARYETASCASSTYAIWVGGRDTSNAAVNTIDYVTIQTTGNATDFGDATSVMRWGSGCSGSPS